MEPLNNIFSVTELNNRIKDLFELDPMLLNVCVRGELSNYKRYPSGHHYFTLKDSGSSVRCVMFKSYAERLRFLPENGMSVLAFGRVSVYPRDGAYQLYCSRIEPEGSGDLQIAFEQLKAKLEKEGLFDDSHKRALPKYPRKIAVITSEAGAAVHDIINILDRRWPLSEVLVLPVKVQGEEAPAEIAAALRYANGYKVADLIITGRGGGSAEDLWAFNDERVARAIFDSVIPVISAVGHEPDVTISDYVADRRASTPSNAAETAVPDQRDIRVYLKSLGSAAARSLEKELEAGKGKLNIIKNSRVLTNPLEITDSKREDLDLCRESLTASASSLIQDKRNALSGLSDRLNALSPLNVLSRGFSFSTDMEGKAVNGVRDLKAKDRIRIRFSDGTADCTVDSVIRED
ncbi:MAG: exodeoxyribonuclease VII large subunit [Oscillospiraceae bacterium]|nr:exodeoxyribonuclease VII large subunit [Oscillospiraceae bacterium]